ncbi:sugar transporter SWEET1-like [Macrosteles quadrilineatus]|uniref:sugar transporter SWEET1-like n=1 Tax=Macrosteles quadrilineatus TaxID=74068 RepID=UPI0023E1E19F|nr:sugar transporter SWEET1-like [Macrosteles quadrilineatus]XP_054288779.1 sugar transporter SWEET1-like [Macrosteles quadrilineatus]
MGLADYKDAIGTAASASSFVLLLSPVFLCLKIWKNKSSQGIPFFPLMEMMARSVLLVQQGLLMKVKPMVFTHSIGIMLNLVYITVYVAFTKDKRDVKKSLWRLVAFLAPLVAYAHYEDKALVEYRFGNITTTLTILLMFYHLYHLKHVFKTKDTKDLPFPILVAAALVTFLWTLYGTAINKPFIQIQTGFGFLVCLFELSLFLVFPSKPEQKKTN